MEVHDRLKAARIDQGEALASVARRTGVAERLLRAGAYFVWLGGLMGTTAGRRSVRIPPSPDPCRPLRLRAIATRAIRYAADEGRFIRDLGVWLGRMITSTTHRRSIPRARALRRAVSAVSPMRGSREHPLGVGQRAGRASGVEQDGR